MSVAFPQTCRIITVELFVNGGWVDISGDVYVRNSIVIKRGRADEQSRAAPSSCQLTIDNRSGNYSPRNPMGLYYGSLGRNTPIRVSVGQANDTFTRTVASGWSTSDTGQTYTTEGAGSSVSGGQGRLSIASGSGIIGQVLNGLTITDVEVSAFATLPFSLPTGASVLPVMVKLRRYSSGDYVYAWARVETTGLITCGITHTTAGVIAAPVTTAITFSAAAGLNIRAHAEGQTYRVKVWAGNTPEPYDWTNVTSTSTVSMTPGSVGIAAWATTGNTNGAITATIDNIVVRVPRFSGEVSSWPQRWDLSGNDVYVPIEAAGLKRRLVQQAPFRSPLRRFHDQLALPAVDYWPCEDLKLSQYCASAVGDVPLVPLDGDNGNEPVGFSTSNLNDAWIAFDDYPAYPGSAPIATLPQRGEIVPTGSPAGTPASPLSLLLTPIDPVTQFWNPPYSSAGGHVMYRWLMTVTKGTVEPQNITGGHPVGAALFTVTVGTDILYITYWTGGFIAVETAFSGYLNGPFSITGGNAGDIRDRDFLYSLQLTASGANTLYILTLLEVGAAFQHTISGTLTGINMTLGTSLVFIGIDGLTAYHVGHASIRLENTNALSEVLAPLNAWSGPYSEPAGTRFSRLCTEEFVNWYYRGVLAQTTLMGPQGSGSVTGGTSNSASLTRISTNQTFLDLLYEVEDVDLGMLYEPRGDIGLEYRTRRDLYSQVPTLTLDYSQKQVAPPLEPVDDDQRTRNNIVVTQPSGLSAEAELTAGRMSTLDPSLGGVGNYNAQYTINTTVSALADTATFLLSLGTVDEARYPTITVNLANPNTVAANREPSALAVNIGDLITLTNPKTGVTFDTIRQIVQGYTEVLNVFQHTITFNTSPETPYRLAQVSATPAYKVDTTTSTLAAGYSTTDVSLSVNNVNEPWTTDPAQMPIPITVAGELMNVTAVSGTSTPQTFTVTRSVNGVVKTQSSGASVQIARPQRPFVAF